jgi:hypothetical protein
MKNKHLGTLNAFELEIQTAPDLVGGIYPLPGQPQEAQDGEAETAREENRKALEAQESSLTEEQRRERDAARAAESSRLTK